MSALRTRAGSILLACALLACPVFAQDPDTLQTTVPNNVWEFENVYPTSWHAQVLADIRNLLSPGEKDLFKGNAALSRYRFAEALAQVLGESDRQLETGTATAWTRSQLDALTRLAQEFEAELAVLRTNTTRLEGRLAQVEESRFSSFSKLDGSVVMAITGGGGCSGCTIRTGVPAESFPASPAFGDALEAVTLPINQANTSFVGRTTLNLRASFTGNDELRLRMRGVTGQDISAALPGIASGIGVLIFAGGPQGTSFDGSTIGVSTSGNASFNIDEVRYIFSVSESLRFYVGPRLEISEYLDTNSFANSEEIDVTGGLFTNSPLLTFVFFGPGVGFDWDIGDALSLRGIYIANNGGAATGNVRTDTNQFGVPVGGFGAGGLFGGETTLVGELEVRPGPGAAIKLQYGHLVDQGGILGSITLPSLISNSVTDAWGVNFEWAVTPSLAVFGRYSFGNVSVNGLPDAQALFSTVTLNTWQAGLTLPDFGGEGNALAVTVAQPLRAFTGTVDGLLGPGVRTSLVPSGVETDVQVFWRFQLSDRLSITPMVQFIAQPVNSQSSNGLTIGVLRAVFSF